MLLKKHFASLIMMLLASAAFAEIPWGYYSELNGLSGAKLKKAVKVAAKKNYERINYGTDNYKKCTWKGFMESDTRVVNGVQCWWDMYSNNNIPAPAYNSHGDMNIEHAVANSWWGGNTSYDAYYDLFHLNPADAEANNHKSNYPLGVVQTVTWTNDGNVTTVGIPASGTCGGATRVYEPTDEYKGDFARAFFYIFTAYDDISWKTSSTDWMYDTSSDLTLKPWAYQMLLEWAKKDPVSQKEIDRNEAISKYQGNRNPFIDCPELAEHIWGSLSSTPFYFDEPGVGEGETFEISEDFTATNTGLPNGSANKPSTAQSYVSSVTGIEYEIMGCYVNNYENPYYLLVNGKNNSGAYMAFILDYNCSEIKLVTSSSCSTNSSSAVNVYADGHLLGKYVVNKQGTSFPVQIPEEYQAAGTVYKIQSATTSYNQQFAGFTYCCYKDNSEVLPERVSINLDEVSLEAGDSFQLTATVYPSDTTNPSVIWTSSDTGVVTVSSTGLLTAVGAGEAVVTATCGSVSDECHVVVKEKVSEVFDVTEDFGAANLGLPVGTSAKPDSPKKYTSSVTGINYEIMGCYINNYGSPNYILINGKNNKGAYISFTLDDNCQEIRMLTTSSCSVNPASAVNVYADDKLLGKYSVNAQNAVFSVEIPDGYQKAGTVYKIESATSSYNQQFAGFTYVCYKTPATVAAAIDCNVDSHKARKIIRDGRILIIVDGRTYDIYGCEVK